MMPFDRTHKRPAPGRQVFLPNRAALVLDNAKGTVLAVEEGCLWVTLEHDPRDVILVRGMRFRIDRPGRTVVAAEEDARFRVVAPTTARGRIVAWFRKTAQRTLRQWARRLTQEPVPYF